MTDKSQLIPNYGATQNTSYDTPSASAPPLSASALPPAKNPNYYSDQQPTPPSHPYPYPYPYRDGRSGSVIIDIGDTRRDGVPEVIDQVAEGCCGGNRWCGLASDHFVEPKKLLLRRVYAALTAQLLLTWTVVMVLITNSNLLTGLLRYYLPIMICAFVVAIALMIALFCGAKDSYPMNLVLMALFTLAMSVIVAIGCGAVVCDLDTATHTCQVNPAGMGVVVQAVVLTMAIFLGLTCYELQTKRDFGWMGGILCLGLGIMILWGLVIAIFGWSTPMIYSLIGVVIFTGYILYDTSNLIHKYGPEDWIMASIQLYLDIINLFLYILQLLSKLQDRD